MQSGGEFSLGRGEFGGAGRSTGHTKIEMFRRLLEPSRDKGGSQISGYLETRAERR